jgi:hypothetical protein
MILGYQNSGISRELITNMRALIYVKIFNFFLQKRKGRKEREEREEREREREGRKEKREMERKKNKKKYLSRQITCRASFQILMNYEPSFIFERIRQVN